jgi:hypothetical protein
MLKFINFLKQEFHRAPLWQKVFLLILISFAIFYFAILPLFGLSKNILKELDETRDQHFRRLQAAIFLIEDSKIIASNFEQTSRFLAENAWQADSIEQYLKTFLTENSRQVYAISFPEEKQQKFDLLKVILLQARLRCSDKQAIKILNQLSSIKYCDILFIEYKDNIMLIDAEILAAIKQMNKAPVISAPDKPAITQPIRPKLNGFFTSRGKTRALINGRLYSIGDKTGIYTIISLNSSKRTVVLQHQTDRIVLKMNRRGR